MRFCLLLWICAAWLGQCHSKAADPLTDAFLPTTRIIGAVTLQKQICDNEKIIPDVISELINVDKDIFKEFMTKHLESDIKGIKNASEFLRKTKSVDSVKLDKTLKGFAKLTGLKKQEANLKEEYIEKAVASIEKSASVSVKLQQDKKEFSVLIFKSVKNLLEDIVNQNLTGNNEDLKNKFVPIYTQLEILESKLPLLIDYKNQYADFLALDTMEKTVNGALEVVELIRGVFDNFDDIKVFDSVTPLLTEQMLPLRRNIAQFVKHQKSIKSIGESLKIISQLKYSESKREFLNGLPNGSEDLKAVTQDLKSSWFLNNWANGKKTDSIENGLKAIIESSNSFTNATNQMKTISIDSGAVKSFQEFEKAVSELVTLGEQAIKNNNAEETLGKMSPCVQQMAQTGTVPKLGETDKIVEYVPKIVERVKSFQEITESLLKDRNLLDNFIAGLKEVITVSKRVFDNSTLQIALDKCKELDLVNNYNNIWTDLLRYSPSQFYLGADTIKASVLSEALTAAKTAKIFDAVVCLPSTAGGVSDLINFSQKFNELKAIDGKLTASIPSLTTVVGFSKEVNKAIAELKKTKTESGTQLICNLPKDYPKTAAPLLVFGSLANNIVKIRSSESSILVVTNSTGPVKTAAESVPDSSLVYNQANRKSLLDTLKSVKNVSDSIGKLGMESSDDLLEISKEIKNIKGFVMANSTILTHISDSLAQNSNPDVKNASVDFKIVSNLDLDFSSSSKVKIGENDFEVLFNPLFPAHKFDWKKFFSHPVVIIGLSIILIAGICIFSCWLCHYRMWLCYKDKNGKKGDIEKGKGKKKNKTEKKEKKDKNKDEKKKDNKKDKGKDEKKKDNKKEFAMGSGTTDTLLTSISGLNPSISKTTGK